MVTAARTCLAGLAAIVMAGCYSPRFTYMETARHTAGGYDCRILSPYGTVEYENGVLKIHPGGLVVARQFQRGKYKTEMLMRLRAGKGVRVRFHTVDMDTGVTTGLIFDAREGGSSLLIPGHAALQAPAIGKGTPLKVISISEAQYFFVQANCDTVFNGEAPGYGTDAISFEAIDSSDVEVYGMFGERLD